MLTAYPISRTNHEDSVTTFLAVAAGFVNRSITARLDSTGTPIKTAAGFLDVIDEVASAPKLATKHYYLGFLIEGEQKELVDFFVQSAGYLDISICEHWRFLYCSGSVTSWLRFIDDPQIGEGIRQTLNYLCLRKT